MENMNEVWDLWNQEFNNDLNAENGQNNAEKALKQGENCVFEPVDVDKMVFSYSRLSSYKTCPYGWFLQYSRKLEGVPNAFAQYGTLIHETLEKYFRDELKDYQLSQYYLDHFNQYVTANFPSIFPKMRQQYFEEGERFFDFFAFDKSKYEIICIEETYQNEKFNITPDLVLKEIATGEIILVDYKTSKPEKAKEYATQMNLYIHFMNELKGFKISKIKIWFVRFDKWVELKIDTEKAVQWMNDTIQQISEEKEWKAKPDKFFCPHLCSQRLNCNKWYNQ